MALCLLLRISRVGVAPNVAQWTKTDIFPFSWSPASGGDYAAIYTYISIRIYLYLYIRLAVQVLVAQIRRLVFGLPYY